MTWLIPPAERSRLHPAAGRRRVAVAGRFLAPVPVAGVPAPGRAAGRRRSPTAASARACSPPTRSSPAATRRPKPSNCCARRSTRLATQPIPADELDKVRTQLLTGQLKQRQTAQGIALRARPGDADRGRPGARQQRPRRVAGGDRRRRAARAAQVRDRRAQRHHRLPAAGQGRKPQAREKRNEPRPPESAAAPPSLSAHWPCAAGGCDPGMGNRGRLTAFRPRRPRPGRHRSCACRRRSLQTLANGLQVISVLAPAAAGDRATAAAQRWRTGIRRHWPASPTSPRPARPRARPARPRRRSPPQPKRSVDRSMRRRAGTAAASASP